MVLTGTILLPHNLLSLINIKYMNNDYTCNCAFCNMTEVEELEVNQDQDDE